ncbi:MAG: protein phosphatase 2C domain-containing protein [Pseudomonadota bacterium]
MTAFEVLGAVNDTGKAGRTGDDRYGSDPSAGTAWIFDGATDVTDLRPFPGAESGAAWFSEALSAWLVAHPPGNLRPRDYWRAAFEAMRAKAARDSKVPLDHLPLSASPIAAGIWLHWNGPGEASAWWLGDCIALHDRAGHVSIIGAPDKAENEIASARALNALSAEDKKAELQRQRAMQNTRGRWIFGLNPAAAAEIHESQMTTSAGDEILLMTDGFYRLVTPYGMDTPESLLARIRSDGLDGAIRALRDKERSDTDTSDRIKARDDAAALWLRVI